MNAPEQKLDFRWEDFSYVGMAYLDDLGNKWEAACCNLFAGKTVAPRQRGFRCITKCLFEGAF